MWVFNKSIPIQTKYPNVILFINEGVPASFKFELKHRKYKNDTNIYILRGLQSQ